MPLPNSTRIALLVMTTLALYARPGAGQTERWHEAGLPALQNFRPADYQAGRANEAIAQDDRGVLYVANEDGILEYDGASWRRIHTPERATVRSLCFANGTIYAGAQNDLGYLAPDSLGQVQFVSLRHLVPEAHRDFKGIWETLAIGDTLFFRSYYSIFRLAGGQMRVWKPETLFHNAYVAAGRFYVREHRIGLKVLRGDSLVMAGGGEYFAGRALAAMLPLPDGRILVPTRFDGLLLYDGERFRELPTPADEFLRSALVFHAAMLPGDYLALATQRRGLALLDLQGNLLQVIDKRAGLRDNTLTFVHRDRQAGLWLALSDGLARVDLPAPLSSFSESTGLEGKVSAITRHQDRLYVATNLGVFALEGREAPLPRLTPIDGLSHLVWDLLSTPEHLLAGTHLGIYRIDGQKATKLDLGSEVTGVTTLQPSRRHPGYLYAGFYRGLGLVPYPPRAGAGLRPVQDFPHYVVDIVEDDGGVWVGTRAGLFHVQLDSAALAGDGEAVPAQVIAYGPDSGIPAGTARPVRIGGDLRVATPAGLRRFDAAQQRFVPDSTLGAAFADSTCAITHLREDGNGTVWLLGTLAGTPLRARLERQPDGSYRIEPSPLARLREMGDVSVVYSDEDGVAWFGGPDGLLRFTPAIARDYAVDYPTLIRRVRALHADSLFYGGAAQPRQEAYRLDFGFRSLRFEFAAPVFEAPGAVQYQVRLDGFDGDWSAWSTETHRDYTALPPGDYVFRVRSRNLYQHAGREASFAFRILAPWYRSAPAYLLYALLAAGLVAAIVRFRVRHLQQKTRQLEALIAQRTATIREQADKLEALDRLKSRFFANISHEFRTPLTLILGPLEQRLRRARSQRDRDELGMIQRHAHRLLQLINQLLDLSRLESGRLQLRAGPADFVAVLRGIVMSFASLAEQKGIALRFEPLQDSLELYFDRDKIEQIFANLLANAFKFTPDGGTIAVTVGDRAGHDNHADQPTATATATATVTAPPAREYVQISVKDTGIGIAADRLPYIFDRFYQADDSTTRAHEGSGIGLALVKELVELHHGTIEVKSQAGKGSEFIVGLPMGKAHLREEEIVPAGDGEAVEQGEPLSSPLPKPEWVAEPEADVAATEAADGLEQDATIVLVVDDHPDMRRYLRETLASQYRVIEASDGRSGRQRAAEVIPDLVVSDVMMPEVDGYQFCAALRSDERTSHIPVILLTAKAGEEDKLAGLQTGADDYLVKPFSPKELQVRARNLIEQRRKLRQRFVREGLLRPRDVRVASVDENFLQRLMAAIEANLAEEHFSVVELSGLLHMGPRQLHRKVRALTGQSPVELIRSVRLHRARQLLAQKAGSISEIAFQVGFNNLSYFAKAFRDEFGQLPSEIIRS